MASVPFDQLDGFIWMNGEFVKWADAKIHVLTHGLHYASAVFEGERAYGGKIFKLTEHTQRLHDSAKILGFTTDERALRQLTLSWGATPYLLTSPGVGEQQVERAIELARLHGEIRSGDLVAVLSGSTAYPGQATDTLRLIRV